MNEWMNAHCFIILCMFRVSSSALLRRRRLDVGKRLELGFDMMNFKIGSRNDTIQACYSSTIRPMVMFSGPSWTNERTNAHYLIILCMFWVMSSTLLRRHRRRSNVGKCPELGFDTMNFKIGTQDDAIQTRYSGTIHPMVISSGPSWMNERTLLDNLMHVLGLVLRFTTTT